MTYFLKSLSIALLIFIPNAIKAQNAPPLNQPKSYILFSARNPSLKPFSIGGHGFVSWVKQSHKDTLILANTLGFYPNLNINLIEKIFEFHEGEISRDYSYNKNGKKVEQIIFEVDTIMWCNSQNISFTKKKKNWNLMRSNCVFLMDEVAQTLQLERPKTMILKVLPLRPVRYIKKLRRLNKDKVAFVGYVCLKEKLKCL